MRICVIGGGHIGTALVCYIKHYNPNYYISLYTRRPERFSQVIKCNDIEGGYSYAVKPDAISDDPAIAAKDANLVLIALPHFAVEKAFKDVSPFVEEDAFIGIVPGSGGNEFYFERYFKNAHLFGLQRVPFTAKLVEYGREVNLKSWKPYSVVGSFYRADNSKACELLEQCGLKTRTAANYLAVSLTPSNPVLHTSRNFELFGETNRDDEYDEIPKFYVGWGDIASSTMLSIDAELHALFDAIPGLDMSSVRPLTEHYGVKDEASMTKKINSIATFQTVNAPMTPSPYTQGKYIVDTESRMFTEDFPWGLAIIRGYCEIFQIPAPTIDKVLGWYASFMGLEYYVGESFVGNDLSKTGIPQNYGISEPHQVVELFSK